MLKNLKIASILGGIALVCAVLIALVNMLTTNTIASNKSKKELATIQAIFEDYDKQEEIKTDGAYIDKKIKAFDKDGNLLGYLYTVSGKNAYGSISLMVAIVDDSVYQVEFLTNDQSFASTVYNHLKTSYPSSADTAVHVGAYKDSSLDISSLSKEEVENMDVNCGATYGATLIKNLVLAALNDGREA